MKNILQTILISFLVLTPFTIQASENQKTDHYEGKEFGTAEEARAALISTTQKMAAVINTDTLDVSKMEEVHQISYTTEDALAIVAKHNKKYDFEALAEKLEAVHQASEHHKTDILAREFVVYQAELIKYLK